MRKNTVLILLSLFLFSAYAMAGSLQQNVPASAAWAENPPADNSHYFYGVGYGGSVEDAKNDALSQISSKISVSVASTFSSSTAVERLGDQEDVLQKIKNDVIAKNKQIEFTNVKILKQAKKGDKYIDNYPCKDG